MTHLPPNHGCTKCVINDGFMGPIAELLAESLGEGHAAYKPAMALAAAANAATKVFDHAAKLGLRSMPQNHKFTGCNEAEKLMAYVGDVTGDGTAMATELSKMRDDVLKHISDVVSDNDHEE
jgi:hypothetical protein